MYFLITFIRNLLFKHHIMKSRKYDDVFVLCVGNLRVGGTGKTASNDGISFGSDIARI